MRKIGLLTVVLLVLAGATVTVFAAQDTAVGEELQGSFQADGGVLAEEPESKDAAEEPEGFFIGDADGNSLSDDLDAVLATAAGTDRIPCVVMLNTPPSDGLLRELEAEVSGLEADVVWDAALDGFAADLTPEQIDALSRHESVVRIDYDREYSICMDTAKTWTGVSQAVIDFGVTGDRDGNPTSYSSTDVVICVLDTGIDTGHVDLDGGKVIGWKDCISGRVSPYDDNGHGSHCSGIAAGTGEGNGSYKGVAPGAALVGVKVLNWNGRGSTRQIINGINWMISHRTTYNIRIGSMSLGSAGSSDGTDATSVAVNNAVASGIVMVVAAGNSGPRLHTIGSPAAATGAVTVGALIDPGEKGWALAYFSSRGPTRDGRTKPDLCTPGYKITSVKANTANQYATMSGTSMATPFCAGVVALMLDADNSLTVSGVKNILYASGNVKDFGPSGKDNDFGAGIALCYRDVKQAGGYAGSWTDGLVFNYHYGALSGMGDYDDWYFSVTDSSRPIGVTLIIDGWTIFKDFDMYLYNPSGVQVATAIGTKRQETITYQPTVTGQYRLRVRSYLGWGNYWFNTSWK